MALSEQDRKLIERTLGPKILNDGFEQLGARFYSENLSALLDAARAEQKEDAEPVACAICAGSEIVAVGNGQYEDCECAEGGIGTSDTPAGWAIFNPDNSRYGDLLFAREHPARVYADVHSDHLTTLEARALYAHPPRAEQPVLSREAVIGAICEHVEGAWPADVAKAADAILPPPSPGGEQEAVAWRVSCANGEWFYTTEKPTAFNPAHVFPLYASPVRGAGVEDKTAAETERLAQEIYEGWAREDGYVPWVNGGNSLKQDEARKLARDIQAGLADLGRRAERVLRRRRPHRRR